MSPINRAFPAVTHIKDRHSRSLKSTSSFELPINTSSNTVLKRALSPAVPSRKMDTGLCETNALAGLSQYPDSMDPLLAAAAHNKEFSLVLKLPDEILLLILQFLQPDVRDIYYIRRVCRKLRCLADDHTLEPRLFSTNPATKGSHMLHRDKFLGRENNRMPFGILPWSSVPEFVATIRKQTLCEPCQTAHRDGVLPNGCVFMETPQKYIHCAGCNTRHTRHAFSHTQRQKGARERLCIGREGRLRLCEHVSIGWADIEAHLVASSGKYDFLKAVSDFHIACKHPSHNFACKSTSRLAPSEASCNDHTRPCARLHLDPNPTFHQNRLGTYLSLVLCWKPYSGSKILTAPENGQLEATRLRELYGEFGTNAARFIVPGPSQNATPEMLCFDPDKCGHILYRNGERPQDATSERLCTPHLSGMNRNSPVTATEIPFDEDHQDASRFTGLGWTEHYVEFNEARGQSGIYVYECDGKHDSQDSSRCLMTSYRRTIMLGHIDLRLPALNPSHQWFHAVDQDSYPSIQAEGGIWAKLMAYFDRTMSRPRCRDTACRNYFQSPGPWHDHNMHRPCGISFFDFEEEFEFCEGSVVVPSRAGYLRLFYKLRHCLVSLLLSLLLGIVWVAIIVDYLLP